MGFNGKRVLRMAATCAAVALVAGIAAGCGSDNGGGSGSSGGKGKIAFLLPESKTARYEQQDRPNFVKRVDQLCPDCEVVYSNADQDAGKQLQQAEAAITKQVDVMVLDAVDVKAAASIVAKAKQAQIPVISYGRLVSDADLDYYVSIDPFKVGQQQAQSLVGALGDAGGKRVVMINGSP